jgi:glycosyltransferase involved in cell wall biosynthesis
MKDAAYVTFDKIDINNGAGLVCTHEIKALSSVSETPLRIISQDTLLHVLQIYGYQPFLLDYFAAKHLPVSGVDLLHLSCSPGRSILDTCKPKHYVVNIVAHDLSVSIEEHEMYYGIGSYPFKHNTDPYLHGALLEHALNADYIITPSQSAKRWIEKNIRTYNIEVIHHGCDIPLCPRAIPTNFTIGYLGAFGPDKGLPYLYMGWKEYDTDNVTLLFGGNCDKFVTPNFPGAKTTGWVQDVKDFYSLTSVYVQPSVTEGFGIEILEAMAYGIPVIATTGTAGPDIITNGVDGFIVPPRDPLAIKDKIQYFAEHPYEVQEMGARARETAKKYTWDIVEQKYRALYRRISS